MAAIAARRIQEWPDVIEQGVAGCVWPWSSRSGYNCYDLFLGIYVLDRVKAFSTQNEANSKIIYIIGG